MRASRRRLRVFAAWAALLVATACAPTRTTPERQPIPEPAPDPDVFLRTAVAALDAADFTTARRRLLAIAHDCSPPSAEARDRAALLLASLELDVRNPYGRPDAAASVAARMLVRSKPGDPNAAVARVLYTLALDRGARPVDPHWDLIRPGYGCPADRDPGRPEPAPLPRPISRTSAGKLAALQDTLAMRTDSLGVLHERLSESRARTEALEAEIERIRQLLRGPGPADDPRPHR